MESAFRLGISSPSCTTTACSWTAPRSKQAIFLRAQDMKFVKPKHARQKGKTYQIIIHTTAGLQKGVKPLQLCIPVIHELCLG